MTLTLLPKALRINGLWICGHKKLKHCKCLMLWALCVCYSMIAHRLFSPTSQ